LRGDDAAGVKIARALQSRLPKSDALAVIDAGCAPENQTGTLRRFTPDLVLLIDAAQMDEAPGAVRWLDWQTASGLGASTHTLPLAVFARYLVAELGCQVKLIGIQPGDTSIGSPLSPEVQQTVDEIARRLLQTAVDLCY
jgi:hydrogenase 3 maturation protease